MSLLGDVGDRVLALGRAAAARLTLDRRQHYRTCFCGSNGRLHRSGTIVVADLARYAGVGEGGLVLDSTGRADPVQMALMLGRRQTLERLLGHLPPDDQDVYQALAAARAYES